MTVPEIVSILLKLENGLNLLGEYAMGDEIICVGSFTHDECNKEKGNLNFSKTHWRTVYYGSFPKSYVTT